MKRIDLAALCLLALGTLASQRVLAESTPAKPKPAKPPVTQEQACANFASKIKELESSKGKSEAQSFYAKKNAKLAAHFGANPCPAVKAP